MRVGSHQAYPFGRLSGHGYVAYPSVALASVLQDEGLGAVAEVCRIDGPVVGSIPASKALGGQHAPV